LRPLEGIRVLDLSRVLAGPFATITLADLGAEVIKVEEPGKGDQTRTWGPPYLEGESTYFLSINRSKLGITLDFKKPKGRELLFRLLERSDVMIENFRAGVLDRNGLGFQRLSKSYPRLIYCSITGYGHTGPRSAEPGFDVIIQGESGIMSVTGDPEGPPCKVGVPIADIVAGMYAVQGILAALFQRQTTGRGRKIDVALLDSMISALTYQAGIYFGTGVTPQRMGNRHPSLVPYEIYEASDGYFTIGVTNESLWNRFCDALRLGGLKRHPLFSSGALRVKNYKTLRRRLVPLLRRHKMAYWLDRLRTAGIPCGEVRSVAQALKEPQLRAREMILELDHPKAGKIRVTGSPMKMSGMEPALSAPPPLLGQHNREVYCGLLGLSPEELRQLRTDRII
jgi:crotonobetainyl-CoA:carnitine CoA-transferase CaiB-like acyl-CoA transferase